MKKLCATAVMSLAIFSASVSAHDVWLEPQDKGYKLVYGHPGELEDYDPAKAKAVKAIDQKGKAAALTTHVHDSVITMQPPAGTSLITIDYDNGFWAEDASGHHLNKSKKDVPGYKSSIHSKKFNKTVLSWSDAAGKPVGVDFEILPLSNPTKLKPGDSLPIQLIYQGKPLAGAEVEIFGSEDLFKTDAEGKVTLPITNAGFQYIQASHKKDQPGNPDADTLSLSTNLTFYL